MPASLPHRVSDHLASSPPPPHTHSDRKKLPFFLYIYVDQDIVVARGRSGGLALWARTQPDWEATSGVLAVYK